MQPALTLSLVVFVVVAVVSWYVAFLPLFLRCVIHLAKGGEDRIQLADFASFMNCVVNSVSK